MLKKYIKHTFLATAVIGSTMACEPEIDREAPSYEQARGDADFSVYVALGNSLTAGYADNALNREGQLSSYPAIIANKLDYIVPDFEFNQPLLPEGRANGTLLLTGISESGLPILIPEMAGLSNQEIFAHVEGSFNNLGVPGAKVGDLTLPGYGSAQGNDYFARFASAPTTTIVNEAVALNPTFFTLWIGNNDVLGYATTGGTGTITPTEQFQASMEAIVNQLTESNGNIEGAIANIPNVTGIPFLNTVPWNAFELTADQAATANAAYEAQITPNVKAKVDSAVLRGVIRAVVSEGARRKIIDAVVTEGARREIIGNVAPQVVYQQAYDAALAEAESKGLHGAEAEAAAKAEADKYVASDLGLEAISGLTTNLTVNRAPEAVHNIVLQNLYSDPVQEQISATSKAAYEDIDILGPEGVAAVDQNLNSAEVQNRIDSTTEIAFENRSNLEPVLGPEGAAAVEQNFNSEAVVTIRETQLNEQLNQLKAGGFFPVFQEGPNGFLVYSEQSPTTIKQLAQGEKMLITFLSQQEYNPASGQPVPDKFALDQFEIAAINTAIMQYNQIIAEVATKNTFALVDMNAFFDQIVEGGITEEGTKFTAAFITGNAFSLDGVHLTQKGNALVAKKFIQEINSYYKSDIPLPNVRNYPAVALP